MVKGVDELIYFLLEHIALRSGVNYSEFEGLVNEFYSQPDENNSSSQPQKSYESAAFATFPGPATVDAPLLDKVWQWLSAHSEILVQSEGHNGGPLESTQHDVLDAATTLRSGDVALEANGSTLADKYKGLVLHTTPERVWQAIAGHEVDEARLPKLEFELLKLIAATGDQGINQPTLLLQSNQDKRSLPKRTDALHQKGYIFKTPIRRSGQKTSHCILRKFARARPEPDLPVSWIQLSPAEIKATVFPEALLLKRHFLAAAMEFIKNAGTISLIDFRTRMGIRAKSTEQRLSDTWLYQLQLVGCIERLARSRSTSRATTTSTPALRFIKDVDEAAYDAYMKVHNKHRQAIWEENQSQSEMQPPPSPASHPDVEPPISVGSTNLTRDQQPAVRWHPQQPLENQLYDIIHESGISGISMLELEEKLGGAASYRALDTILSHLADVWQESQPPHLRHLAIVRDTALDTGTLRYNYRTLPNFHLAVQASEASWEAVNEAYEKFRKINKQQRTRLAQEFDVWGFPVIPESEFFDAAHQVSSKKRGQPEEDLTTPEPGDAAEKLIRTPNKRRKLDGEVNRPSSPLTPRGRLRPPSVPKVEPSKQHFRQSKAQSAFEAQMRRRTSMLIANGVAESLLATVTEQRNQGSTAFHHATNALAASQSISCEEDVSENTYRHLLHISLPGVYINPPDLLPNSTTRGRPRKRMLLLIKSDGLLEMDWFRNSPQSEIYRRQPSDIFNETVQSNDLGTSIVDGEDATSSVSVQPSVALHDNPRNSRSSVEILEVEQSLEGNLLLQMEEAALPQHNSPRISERSRDKPGQLHPASTPRKSDPKSNSTSSTVEEEHSIGEGLSKQIEKPPLLPSRKTLGVQLTGGSRGRQLADILLQIIAHAGGVYPGPRELWYPLVTALQNSQSNYKPDVGTVQRAVTTLVNSGKLKKFQFAFKSGGGSHQTRSIICLPEIDANSDSVKGLEKSMIESYPESYLPDSVEIDPSLRMNVRRMPPVNEAATRSTQTIPDGNKVHDPYMVLGSRWSRQKRYVSPRTWDPEDDAADEEINEEQLALQSEFVIEGYTHKPTATPQGRNTAGKRLGKLVKLDETPNHPINVPPSPSPALALDPALDFEGPSDLPRPNNAIENREWKFVEARETSAAAYQEFLREQQFYNNELNGASQQPFGAESIRSNPNAWIVSSTKLPYSPRRSGLSVAVTFTDPNQSLHHSSGTFSTEFAVFRDLRPKLQISPNLQREFEDQVPNSLIEIIEKHRDQHSLRSKRKNTFDTFGTIIDEISAWEQDNTSILASSGTLMTPRFINHSAMDVSELSLRSSRDKTDTRRKRPYSASKELSPSKRQKRSQDAELLSAKSNKAGTVNDIQTPAPRSSITHGVLKDRNSVLNTPAAHAPTSKRAASNRAVSFALPDDNTAAVSNAQVLPGQEIPDSEDIQPMLETSRLHPMPHKRPGRKPGWASKLSEPQIQRLITIVVSVRCLLGGTDRVIKWPIVAELFTDFDRSGIKYRWNSISHTRAAYIEAYEKSFQEKFLQGYEEGLVEAPNYDNIEGYDWQALLSWADGNIQVPIEPAQLNYENSIPEAPLSLLFEDSNSFHQHYIMQEDLLLDDNSVSDYLSTVNTMTRRIKVVGDMEFSLDTFRSESFQDINQTSEREVVKSYVRANIFAPPNNYDPNSARARLIPFGEAALSAAIKDLQRAKIIKQENKGRAAPGRNYSTSKTFFDGFKGNWRPDVLTSAVQYKQRLDDKFAAGEHVEFSPHSSQGEVLAILNLQAAGELDIRIISPSITKDPTKKTIDPVTGERSISIWGFTEGDYKTVHVDTKNFIFPLVLTPTAKWTSGFPLSDKHRVPPALHHANRFGQHRIPLWYDIHDRFLPQIWELVVTSVAMTIALAPGANAKEVVSMCRKTIDKWDVKLVLEWMEEVGLAKKTLKNGDRFVTAESWWSVLGNGLMPPV